jgi:Ca-activated chloride channel family protein
MKHRIAVWGLRTLILGTLLAALGWLLVGASVDAHSAPPQQSAVPAQAATSAARSAAGTAQPKARAALTDAAAPGSLEILDKGGKSVGLCPLKHTDVNAEISGFLARVTVKQQFWNPSNNKIEAIYVFPLPQNSAVDDMTLHVGERTVRGLIKRREEAQKIYQQAKQQGQIAALLDQERPNIFTQSVANIEPGAEIEVEISYVEVLKYEAGSYEFVFPMVVGPRYIPGQPIGAQAGGWAPDTNRVPDASRITPPVAGVHTPNTRAGHDISIAVKLDAGVPVQNLRSVLHQIDSDRTGASSMKVRLHDQAVIPNKDFILKYDVAGAKIEDALLTHTRPIKNTSASAGGAAISSAIDGYFTFILQPPDKVAADDVTPREIIFVIDTSGSQAGFPIEKSKKLAELALDHLNPNDTFNIITFAGSTQILFSEPVAPTKENLARARALLTNLMGGGGTEMMKAIRAALDPSDSQKHLRVVVFMTDGYVGNDMEIIGEVQKHQNARVFSLGIGNSVNRFLIDKMAEAGRGEAEYVTLAQQADEAVEHLFERVRTPLLTDVEIDWNGLPVTDIYPARIPDLFRAKPVIVTGRYTKGVRGKIYLRGKRAGEAYERAIPVNFSSSEPAHDVLSTLWARQRIENLMSQDWAGMQRGSPMKDLKEQITQLGLDYRLMTQFTSFVAVEEKTITKGGQPVTIQVPVEMPEGVSVEGVFGTRGEAKDFAMAKMAREVYVSNGYGLGAGNAGAAQRLASPPMTAPTTIMADKAQASGRHKQSESQGDEESRKKSDAKVHPALQSALQCWEAAKANGAAPNCSLVQQGQVHVEITLARKDATLAADLQKLGFTPASESRDGLTLLGQISIEKLRALAALDSVRYVAPGPLGRR